MADKTRLAAARKAAEVRDYGETERIAREVANEDPGDLSALDLIGFALYFQGKFEESETICRRCLELDENRAYAHKGLGLCLAKRGRIIEAIVSLERAIALKPGWFDPYWDLAVSLVDARRFTEAIALARRGREALPDRAQDWDRMEKHARTMGARAR
jgi:tetratricopeptide (TPR) repeat protein